VDELIPDENKLCDPTPPPPVDDEAILDVVVDDDDDFGEYDVVGCQSLVETP
jgi:hypothetical protein